MTTRINKRAAVALLAAAVTFGIGDTTFCSTAIAQDLTSRPGPQKQAVMLINVDVYPVDGEPLMGGHVLFDGGVIRSVGPAPKDTPKGARVIDGMQKDGKRLRVYPGLISPSTRIGLEEHGMTRPSMDMNEAGDVTPEAVAASAVNPDSTLIPVARTNGVLLFGSLPTGGTIAGRASVITADGWTTEDMTVRRTVGLVVQWPVMRTIRAPWMDQPEPEQQNRARESQERIKETFRQARAYIEAKDADPKSVPTDLRWEAMREFIPGGVKVAGRAQPVKPLLIEANDYEQIIAALAFVKQGGYKAVIVGGRDAAMASKQLKDAGASVIFSSVISMPRRDDSPYDEAFATPAKLKEAGVPFCLASGEETPHERNLPYAAGMAGAHGLTPAEALRSVTLSAAEILGVADRVGSITIGKDATLIITDGDPLEIRTTTRMAFIQGRQVDLTNKQSILADKYREKYRQQNEGRPDGAAPAKK